jgi:pimeloyl-ACP methyl ester carboxylesterase
VSTPFLDTPFPRLTIPALIVWGLEDEALLPCQLDGLEQHIDDVTIERIEGAGHFVPWEAPDAVNAAMDRWLAGHPLGN